MRSRVLTATLLTVATSAALVLSGTATANAAAATTPVPNTKPGWVAKAHQLGHATAPVKARVYLAPKGGLDALKSAVEAVSTPGTAQYQHFLTTAQYKSTYGTTASTVTTVSKYLKAAGLTVTGVGASNRYISVEGSVSVAEKAFGTALMRYTHNGATVQAPDAAVTVPNALSSLVLTVTGLDTSVVKMTPKSTPAEAPAGFRNATPCSAYYGQKTATTLPKFQGKTLPYAVCGYTGAQLRSAYAGSSSLTGKGVSVGIVDAYAAPTIAFDANTYAVRNGGKAYASGQIVQTVPKAFQLQDECGETGWWGEETLDVEAVHALAPDAKIHYYGAVSCEDTEFGDVLQKVVDDNQVQVISNSYGDLGEDVDLSEVATETVTFLQGALQGQSFLFSSGDSGDETINLGYKAADYSATDPFVTAVGGTATAIGKSGTILGQTGWGTEKYTLSADGTSWSPVGYLYGAGGGSSVIFPKPFYQRNIPGTGRQVPDVAMDADPTTGMLVGETQEFSNGTYYDQYRIGGTSLASPLFAGLTALSVQSAGHRAGLLNPLIYAKRSNFTDVKGTPMDAGNVRSDFANGVDAANGILYSVRTFNQDSSLLVTDGYDNVTGVGVPNSKWLSAFKF